MGLNGLDRTLTLMAEAPTLHILEQQHMLTWTTCGCMDMQGTRLCSSIKTHNSLSEMAMFPMMEEQMPDVVVRRTHGRLARNRCSCGRISK